MCYAFICFVVLNKEVLLIADERDVERALPRETPSDVVTEMSFSDWLLTMRRSPDWLPDTQFHGINLELAELEFSAKKTCPTHL